jgi:hypothetical protein
VACAVGASRGDRVHWRGLRGADAPRTAGQDVPPHPGSPRAATNGGVAGAREVLDRLAAAGRVLAVKQYRLPLAPDVPVPVLPCLDHEASLRASVAPHLSAYMEDVRSGDLHEVVVVPAERRLDIDTVSTWGESSPASHERLLTVLGTAFPGYRIGVHGPSWWRGDRRVADVCHAQVSLRAVLLGHDIAAVRAGIERLQLIAALMEKQSRVASWGIRTVTGPLLAAAGVVTFLLLGTVTGALGDEGVRALQYLLVGLLGATFLYYGLKAVQLTEMANRVWKRTAEYNLILAERRRLGAS